MSEDRRKAPRLRMRLDVDYRGKDTEKGIEGRGKVKNVSAGGAYFTTQQDGLEPGSKLHLRLSGIMPYTRGTTFTGLEGEARVLRIEEAEDADKVGIAVKFEESFQLDTKLA